MKIGAFGEVMLRLTPPEYLMLEQTHTLRMSYTGTGVNLVGNLAHFGIRLILFKKNSISEPILRKWGMAFVQLR